MSITERIRKELDTLVDTTYREFHSSLLPGTENILGVRIPLLRKLAKDIAQKDDWRKFIETTDTASYEEVMLQGLVIGIAKMPIEERVKYIEMFIPRINNWAVCDIFCGELKSAVRKNKELIWLFIQPYLQSDPEYKIRYGIVMLFHFIDEEHIDSILRYCDTFRHDEYYARMGMAWLVSICFIKFPEKTMSYLRDSQLDNWTYNKSLQKIIESLRVDKETKVLIRTMKRK